MATNEVLYAPNPSGQVGIWAHSQNVEFDLLKRYHVQIKRPGQFGWLSMLSFDKRDEALLHQAEAYFMSTYGHGAEIRIWDDRQGVVA